MRTLFLNSSGTVHVNAFFGTLHVGRTPYKKKSALGSAGDAVHGAPPRLIDPAALRKRHLGWVSAAAGGVAPSQDKIMHADAHRESTMV